MTRRSALYVVTALDLRDRELSIGPLCVAEIS
jgi:hypothetical protein